MKKSILVGAMWAMTFTHFMDATETTEGEVKSMIVNQLFEKAEKNENWKVALATGKYEQVVLMNVSPQTNQVNEIGMEVHPFDQVILIVAGNAKVVLNGQISLVKEGDMIFIPTGTSHNVINLSQDKGLKLVSFYSGTDIPKNAVYKTKSDQPQD